MKRCQTDQNGYMKMSTNTEAVITSITSPFSAHFCLPNYRDTPVIKCCTSKKVGGFVRVSRGRDSLICNVDFLLNFVVSKFALVISGQTTA